MAIQKFFNLVCVLGTAFEECQTKENFHKEDPPSTRIGNITLHPYSSIKISFRLKHGGFTNLSDHLFNIIIAIKNTNTNKIQIQCGSVMALQTYLITTFYIIIAITNTNTN